MIVRVHMCMKLVLFVFVAFLYRERRQRLEMSASLPAESRKANLCQCVAGHTSWTTTILYCWTNCIAVWRHRAALVWG